MLWSNLNLEQLHKFEKKYRLLFVESYSDINRHKHHKQKLVFLLSSMRHIYTRCSNAEYIKTDLSIPELLLQLGVQVVHLVRPGEYEYLELLRNAGLEVIMHEDETFLCTIQEFQELNPKLMEHFYRYMRRKTGFLMENGKPVGGQWNFDKENRKRIPKNTQIPPRLKNTIDDVTHEVIELVTEKFPNHFGSLEKFWPGVTPESALEALNHFITYFLHDFGKYQDGMIHEEVFLYHSILSHYLNNGLITPLQVCQAVEKASVPVESKEGYIRQIIGWREFVRGIYWTRMPGYKKLNYCRYTGDLPDFYWTGETSLRCLHHVLKSTIEYGYSHHIQRLMITANYSALIGVKPEAICEWYLIAYLDAHEWVELPNTLGMGTFSDGGIVGTKPYICSGAYINRMSDFCTGCRYNPAERVGPTACPFNYLYWYYLLKHDFRKNHRMSIPYSILDKMPESEHAQIIQSAQTHLQSNSKTKLSNTD